MLKTRVSVLIIVIPTRVVHGRVVELVEDQRRIAFWMILCLSSFRQANNHLYLLRVQIRNLPYQLMRATTALAIHLHHPIPHHQANPRVSIDHSQRHSPHHRLFRTVLDMNHRLMDVTTPHPIQWVSHRHVELGLSVEGIDHTSSECLHDTTVT
jgi:hypothetical protein